MDAERNDPQAPSVSPSRRSQLPIVGRAFGLIRTRRGTLLRTAGLVALAGAVPVAILADFAQKTLAEQGGGAPPAAVMGEVMAALMEFLLSVLVLVVAFQVMLGLPRPLEMRRPLGAIGAYLLSFLAALLPMAAVGLVVVGLSTVIAPGESAGMVVLVVVLMLVGLVASAYAFSSLALSMILVIREDLLVVSALRTSWRRMPGHRMRWFGGQLVLGLLLLPVLLLASLLSGWMPTFVAAMLLTTVNSLASAAVISAVATVVYTDTGPAELVEPLEPGGPAEVSPG